MLQLDQDNRFSVWDIAVAFLQWLSLRKPEWAAYVDDEYMDECVENLRRDGVMREIKRRNVRDRDYQAYLYLFDRCVGVIDRDCGYPPFYCEFFPTGICEMAQYFHPDCRM